MEYRSNKDREIQKILRKKYMDGPIKGGFVAINEDLIVEFGKVFSQLREEQVEELQVLWKSYAKNHYQLLQTIG